MTKLILIATILYGSWSYNPSSNERVYWLSNPARNLSYTCGFVSINHLPMPGVLAGQGFNADVVRPSDERLIGSKWFNEEKAAEKYVAVACGGMR